MLRRGLKAASRAGASAVDRVLRRDEAAPYAPSGGGVPRTRPTPVPECDVVTVRFGGLAVEVARGATILDAASHAGVDLRSYCGGNCSCGTCRVEIPGASRRALSRREGLEEMVLGPDAVRAGDRLACQAQILGDCDVVIPEWF